MASTFFNLSFGGAAISEGDNTAPYTVSGLNANNSEVSTAQIVTLSTQAGYKTQGTVTLSLQGTKADRWQLSWDNITWGSWGGGISTNSVITSAGKNLYIRARALPTDARGRDDSVDLKVSGMIMSA